jgi:anti-sigma regulatory factor (Ser/Thr protein kinase)
VSDHGGGFDPERLETHPAVTDPARLEFEGGLGIPLIRLLADELEFRPTDGGTTVVMTFGPRVSGGRVGP